MRTFISYLLLSYLFALSPDLPKNIDFVLDVVSPYGDLVTQFEPESTRITFSPVKHFRARGNQWVVTIARPIGPYAIVTVTADEGGWAQVAYLTYKVKNFNNEPDRIHLLATQSE